MVFWACFYFSHCFYCWNIVTWNEILGRVALFFPPWVSLNHRISVLSFKILGTQITRILFCVCESHHFKKKKLFAHFLIWASFQEPSFILPLTLPVCLCSVFLSSLKDLSECCWCVCYWILIGKKLCQSKSWLACWNTSIFEVYLEFISTGWQE